MQDIEMIEASSAPEPGQVWRHRAGQHYLVVGRSVHAETQEDLVMCRSCAAPYTSIAYPAAAFTSLRESGAPVPLFEKVDD